MSCLSLPAEELSRLQIIIKLQPTMLGQMSFRLQSQPLPNASPVPTAASLKSSPSMYAVNLQTEQDEDGQAILRVFTSLICGGTSTSDINNIDSIASSAPNVTQLGPTQDIGARSAIETFGQVSHPIGSSLTTNDDRRASVSSNISDELKFVPSDFSMSSFFEDNSFTNTSSANHSPGTFSYPDSPQNMLLGDGTTAQGGFDCMSFFDFNNWSSTDSIVDRSSLLSSHENTILRRPTPFSPATTVSTLSPMSTTFDSFDSNLEPERDSSNSDSGRDTDHHRRFRCVKPGCGRRFTSQYTLKVHTEAHKAKPRVSLPCTLGCSERFSRRHDRLRHEVTQHGKVCEWVCSECGRFFSSDKTLGNHKCPTTKISFAPSRVPN